MTANKSQSLQKIIANAIKEADTSYFFEDYTKQASAVLAALKQADIALVPVKPTEQMTQAGVSAIGSGKIRPEDHVRYIYTDMVKAGSKEKAISI